MQLGCLIPVGTVLAGIGLCCSALVFGLPDGLGHRCSLGPELARHGRGSMAGDLIDGETRRVSDYIVVYNL